VADPSERPPNPFADDPTLSRLVRKADGLLGRAEQVALIVLGGFLIFVCLAWLATEHLSDKPLENASADVRYTVYLMAMIGGAYAAHHRRLLSMDVVNRLVKGRARALLRIATTTFALVITAVFFYYCLDLYLDTRHEHTIEHWMPAFAAKAAMAIGSALIGFHLLVQLVIDVDYLVHGKVPPEPEMGAA
jgi:TRAP-type C4-dicarboxylate transport system permease small subunit